MDRKSGKEREEKVKRKETGGEIGNKGVGGRRRRRKSEEGTATERPGKGSKTKGLSRWPRMHALSRGHLAATQVFSPRVNSGPG